MAVLQLAKLGPGERSSGAIALLLCLVGLGGLFNDSLHMIFGALLWLAARFMLPLVLPWAADAHGLVQAAILGLLIAGGIAVYGLLLARFGVVNWADAVQAVRQTPPRDLRR